jgi:SAM-dependent methyltransferase
LSSLKPKLKHHHDLRFTYHASRFTLYNTPVNPSTIARLLDLNRTFYQTFATQFSITRQRLQGGVLRILETIQPEASVLDLGCGNGELARALARRGHQGPYVGLDLSAGLLAEARRNAPEHMPITFIQADLAAPGWELRLPAAAFEVILAFAVLHHIPGAQLRRQILRQVWAQLSPAGRFVHSEWQFLNSPRLRARLQPWEKCGLTAAEVDPGDYLLDWRRGGQGFRYVHLFTISELATLAAETGFTSLETFFSDGEEGKLGLYQIWKRV